MKYLLVFLLVFSLPLFSTEEEEVRRIFAHLMIRDTSHAVIEARRAMEKYPHSERVREALIASLSAKGEEDSALEEWQKGHFGLEALVKKRRVLEEVGWSILTKGNHSDQLLVRIMSLIGTALTHDVKAVPLLIEHLHSSNAALRFFATKFACDYRDAALSKEIARLIAKEQVQAVRIEVIHAAGRMGIVELKPQLREMIASPKTLIEEKSAAMEALLMLSEKVEEEKELLSFFHSNRSGLRELACEITAYFNLKERKEELIALLSDSFSNVRLAAINALGILGLKEQEAIYALFTDSSPEVAIMAGWAALRNGDKRGEEIIEKWITSSSTDLRRFAAAVLAKVGPHGIPLAMKVLKESRDPYVRVNAALGLIGLRAYVEKACKEIADFLNTEKGWVMWSQEINPHISVITQSTVRHVPVIPHYPQLVDDLLRLDLLNILSMMRYPRVEEMVQEFLKHEIWGVSLTAGELLLQEGEGEIFEVVQNLLHSPEESIRLQAALLLAAMGGDDMAHRVLEDAYPTVNRERKTAILEALAQSGSKESLPFLIDHLGDSFQVLRILSASALIQCLYH